MHLAAAAPSVQTLFALIAPDLVNSSHGNKSWHKITLHSEDESAIKFLLGSIISIDIISCASIRSSHFLELDHKIILESTGIYLENFTGCRNWAIVFIFEISQLDRWKRRAENNHQLSVTELAKRGSQIKASIEERLVTMGENSMGTSLNSSPGALSASTHIQITRIFAFAAMTYLHVVVSGAYPELPEIRESVSRTAGEFQNLTDAKLLQHLVWPFCISGCLALESHYAIFRNLVSAAELTQSNIGTLLEASKVIEECWEARKTNRGHCDWVSIMKRRGQCVLLW